MERIGRYEVIRELGHGAMGRVFLARDPTLERSVALKLLAAASVGARERFHEEARALAALSHPGIVTVFEVSEHDGQDFIAMEYLAGRSLRELLEAPATTVSREELVAICGKVAIAVAAAHRAGILHRDIKPENIVVAEDGDVKVVDFGIARRLHVDEQNRPTRPFATPIEQRVDELVEVFAGTMPMTADTKVTPGTQTVFGTPAYMAPEVLMGSGSSEASDVYSLGVTLYECLARRRPFEIASFVELMARVIDGSERPARLDDPLADLVAVMLARDPAARPPLAEVAARLTGAAALPRPAMRRWLPVVGACAVGLAAAGGWWIVRSWRASSAAGARRVIAIEPLAIASLKGLSSDGSNFAVSNAIALAVTSIDGLHVVGPEQMLAELKMARTKPGQVPWTLSAAQLATAEHALGAELAVRGAIDTRGDQVHAQLDVVSVADGAAVAHIEADAPATALANLDLELAERIARVVDPKVSLQRDSRLARTLTGAGEQSMKNSAFYDAQLYFQNALAVDPKFFEAWEGLGLAKGWLMAPDDEVTAAIDHAIALAADELSKQLLTGISQYWKQDYRAALQSLVPLEQKLGALDARLKQSLLYYLGETHWHIGHQATGVDYFRRALDLDPRFAPAAIHPLQYAIARRDGDTARTLIALVGSRGFEGAEFALGHYEALARGDSPEAFAAQLVLGRAPSDPGLSHESAIGLGAYHLARAVEVGDREAARSAIDDVWKLVETPAHPLEPPEFYSLQMFGEVLICAEMLDDTRRLVAFLAAHSTEHPVGGYPRILLLAAPLLHDPSLIVRDYFTDRLTKLADASDAELRGDRAGAVVLLKELVDDPSPTWEYPERAALVRNLRALGDTKGADAVCANALRPAIFRYALLPLRKLCQSRPQPSRTRPRPKRR